MTERRHALSVALGAACGASAARDEWWIYLLSLGLLVLNELTRGPRCRA